MANSQSQQERYDSLYYEMDSSESSDWESDDKWKSTESTESEYELGIDVISILHARALNEQMVYYVKWRRGDEERIRLTWESDWFFEVAECRKSMVIFIARQMFSRNNPTVSFNIVKYLNQDGFKNIKCCEIWS